MGWDSGARGDSGRCRQHGSIALMKDPQILHRNMVLDLEGEDGARARVPGNPTNLRMRRRRPHLSAHSGADTAAVLHEVLRLSNVELRNWSEQKPSSRRPAGVSPLAASSGPPP